MQVVTQTEILKQLKYAETQPLPSWKAEAYCKAAAMQFKNNQKSAAEKILNLASSLLSKKSNNEINTLCKIAKIRLLIAPQTAPDELSAAMALEENSLEKDSAPQRASLMLPTHTKKLCKLAKRFHDAGRSDKTTELISKARACAGRESRIWEGLRHLICIAKAEIYVGKANDAEKILDQAIKDVPSLRESSPQITMWTNIATLLVPINAKKARDLIRLAEREIKNYPGDSSQLMFVKENTKKALAAWEKYTNG